MTVNARVSKSQALCAQLWAAIAASSSLLGSATNTSWGIVACRQLQQPGSQLHLTATECSWLLTSMYVGSAAGAALGGCLSHYLGPRTCMLISLPVSLIGYLIIFYSEHLHGLVVGRLIGGVSSVLPSCVATLYIAGSSSARYRGGLMMMQDLTNTATTAVCVLAGELFHWSHLALLFGVVSALLPALLLSTIPEDPSWLMQHGRIQQSLQAAKALHVVDEISDIKYSGVHSTLLAASDNIPNTDSSKSKSGLSERGHWRCLTVAVMTVVFGVFSGYNALFSYALLYFRQAGVPLSANVVFLLLCSVRALSVIALSVLLDRVGRRVLMISSALGMALCYLILVLIVGPESDRSESEGPLGLVLVLLAGVFYCLGLGPVTWCLVGEMLPIRLRHRACGALVVLYHALTALLLLTFPPLLHSYGQRGVYVFYGALTAVATGFYTAALPETKGLTLRQIETLFVDTQGRWSDRQESSSSSTEQSSEEDRQPLLNGAGTTVYDTCGDANGNHISACRYKISVKNANLVIAI